MEVKLKAPKKDITGMKINQLEVLEWVGLREIGTQGKRRSFYKCRCSCGNLCEVEQVCITSGNTKSCGCGIGMSKSLYKGQNYANITVVLNNYKQSARLKDRQFSLTREEFMSLISSNCHYCGKSPSTERKPVNRWDSLFIYNGVDRVDNNKGYTLENTVPCCTDCNFLKKDIPYKEFLDMIKRIYLCRIQ